MHKLQPSVPSHAGSFVVTHAADTHRRVRAGDAMATSATPPSTGAAAVGQ